MDFPVQAQYQCTERRHQEIILAEKVHHQFLQAALEFTGVCLTLPADLPISLDSHTHGQLIWIGHLPGGGNPWSKRAAASIHFFLREVERILTLNAARADIVADCIADNFSICVYH